MSTEVSKPLAVVLVSGGLDSCVTASLAAAEYDLAFLHLNYGQRTEARERRAFHDLCAFFNVRHQLEVSAAHFTAIGGSSLTDPSRPVRKADLRDPGIPDSYVPFRNANILAVAVSWAESLGARRLFIGAVAEDSSGYPDCRPEFFAAFNQVIALGTRPETDLKIETPILHLSKREIVETGIRLGAPLQLTWSCYQDNERACGVCDSCALRLRGFQQAGREDPLPYRQRPDYR